VAVAVNASIVQVLASPDVIKRQGFTASAVPPDALSNRIRNDISRLGDIIRDLGLSAG
jgi:tripartite-type tricarboxylate transporter receptor subunit TctC